MHRENLWAPWRWSYIRGLDPQSSHDSNDDATEKKCFLCEAGACAAESDEARQRLILVRDERGVLLLNLYPYTNGHLLIAPVEHLADLTELSPSQRFGLMELTAVGQQLLKDTINPQGFNIGINLGHCAGAGLPGHLHVHVVPRWNGDTNFMQVVGDVRVLPQALHDSYERLQTTLRGTSDHI